MCLVSVWYDTVRGGLWRFVIYQFVMGGVGGVCICIPGVVLMYIAGGVAVLYFGYCVVK